MRKILVRLHPEIYEFRQMLAENGQEVTPLRIYQVACMLADKLNVIGLRRGDPLQWTSQRVMEKVLRSNGNVFLGVFLRLIKLSEE